MAHHTVVSNWKLMIFHCIYVWMYIICHFVLWPSHFCVRLMFDTVPIATPLRGTLWFSGLYLYHQLFISLILVVFNVIWFLVDAVMSYKLHFTTVSFFTISFSTYLKIHWPMVESQKLVLCWFIQRTKCATVECYSYNAELNNSTI